MRIVTVCCAFTLCFADILNVTVPAPTFDVEHGRLVVENAAYFNVPGAPNVSCRKVTIALPPGAILESVHFHDRRELERACCNTVTM